MLRFKKKITLIIATGAILSSLPASADSVPSRVKKGNNAYIKNQFDAAAQEYTQALEKKPESDIINYDLGAALYKKGEYAKSIDAFQKSLLTEDESLKEKVHYNLGNALYKDGISKEETKLEDAISQLEKSTLQYEQAVSLDKEDQDAQFNLDFVRKELDRLKKKLEQKKQEQQKKQDQQKQDEQNKSEQPKSDSDQNKAEKEKESEPQSSEQKNKSEDSQKQDQMNQDAKGNDSDENKEKEQQSVEEEKPDQKQSDEEKKEQPQSAQNKPAMGDDVNQSLESGDVQEMTPKEAQMLLEQYQQGEEPKGLLNVNRYKGSKEAVYKDW